MYIPRIQERVAHTWYITAPDSSIVTFVCANTFTVVSVPNVRGMIFGTREEKVSISIILEESERPLVSFQQNGPHCEEDVHREKGRKTGLLLQFDTSSDSPSSFLWFLQATFLPRLYVCLTSSRDLSAGDLSLHRANARSKSVLGFRLSESYEGF